MNQPFIFSLALATASDAATSWAALDDLPPGLSINTTTGAITGIPTASGVVSARITATNGSGTSTPVTVAFGILPLPYTAQGTMEINMDLDTRVVWNPSVTNLGAPLFGKYRDKTTISIGLLKKGILQEKPVSELNVWVRENDDATPFKLSTINFARVGSGDNSRYVVLLDWSVEGVKKMLGNWASPSVKGGFVWAEIEMKFLEAPPGSGSATLLPLTSRTFICEIQRDF